MVITASLIDSMVDIEIANLRSRLAGYAGVRIEQFGAATAFASEVPVRLYNSVLGFAGDTVDHLDAIRDFYAGRPISECIEIVPGRLSEPSGLELGRRGYALVEFHGGYVRALSAADAERPPRPGVAVEIIDPGDEAGLEQFLATHIAGWGGDPEDSAALANMRSWRDNDTWRLLLAAVDGEPAGAAILDIRGDLALLSSGSTRPAMRGRGVQAALIEARLAEAARRGCTTACAGSYFGNASMRNLQRAGFVTAFVRGIWARYADLG